MNGVRLRMRSTIGPHGLIAGIRWRGAVIAATVVVPLVMAMAPSMKQSPVMASEFSVSMAGLSRPLVRSESALWTCRGCYEQATGGTSYQHHFTDLPFEEEQTIDEPGPSADAATNAKRVDRWEYVADRKCRYDINEDEPGCHDADSAQSGRCNEKHAPCTESEEQVEEMAGLILAQQSAGLQAMMIRSPMYVRFNSERQAMQLVDCDGRIVGHMPVDDTVGASLAPIAQRLASRPADWEAVKDRRAQFSRTAIQHE